jgi:MoaA/NifB/PqqE/SkfB family radical SAM enzyme
MSVCARHREIICSYGLDTNPSCESAISRKVDRMFLQDPRNTIRGWYFTEEEMNDALAGKILLNPSIDLTNACNLNCPYCFIEEKNSQRKLRKSNELTVDETLLLLDDLHRAGARSINIVGAGEPTIDPHFEVIVTRICELGIRCVFFTNGIRFTYHPELLEFLAEREVSVVLKYNSMDDKLQDLVAGRQGYASKRNRVLESLIDFGFNACVPTRLGLDVIVFQGNMHEIVDIHTWCRSLNMFPIVADYIPTGRTEYGEFHGFDSLEGLDEGHRKRIGEILNPLSSDERHNLVVQLGRLDLGNAIQYAAKFAYYGGGICTQILGLYVDIEGNIWPCVAKEKRTDLGSNASGLLGNVRNGDRPSSIWRNNEYMGKIRAAFDGGCPYKHGLV